MWLSWLRIQCCHHSGLGHCFGTGLIPSIETHKCHGGGKKKKGGEGRRETKRETERKKKKTDRQTES